jgi:hypothetical protein
MLTPPTLLSHLFWSLLCPLCIHLLRSSMRASQMMRSPCWQESFTPCTSSTRRGGDHPRAASSAATPSTSSPTAPRGSSSTPRPTSMTTPSGTTTIRVTTRRGTSSGRRRRSFRRLCPERVLPSVTLTSPAMTPPAQRRMRRSSTSQVISPAFASWASPRDTSLTPNPI